MIKSSVHDFEEFGRIFLNKCWSKEIRDCLKRKLKPHSLRENITHRYCRGCFKNVKLKARSREYNVKTDSTVSSESSSSWITMLSSNVYNVVSTLILLHNLIFFMILIALKKSATEVSPKAILNRQ